MTNLAISLFMFILFMPILLALYFILRAQAAPKKNVVLGVTLPYVVCEDPRVLDILQGFKRSLRLTFWILLACAIGLIFIPYTSLMLLGWMLWFDAALISLYAVLVSANRKLARLKAENSWGVPSPRRYVDLNALRITARPERAYKQLLPPLISLLPLGIGLFTGMPSETWQWILYGSMVAATVLMVVLYRRFGRAHTDTVGDDTQINTALTFLRRQQYGRAFLGVAWLSAILAAVTWFLGNHVIAQLLAISVYALLCVLWIVWLELRTHRAQAAITRDMDATDYTDDDAHWIGGFVYHNPEDRRTLVAPRIGIGTEVNMAKPIGKVLAVVVILVLLFMPLIGVYTVLSEFTPVRIAYDGGTITATHLLRTYRIAQEDILALALMDTLPKGTRTNGTSIGPLQVDTADATYLLGSPDPDVIEKIYLAATAGAATPASTGMTAPDPARPATAAAAR